MGLGDDKEFDRRMRAIDRELINRKVPLESRPFAATLELLGERPQQQQDDADEAQRILRWYQSQYSSLRDT